MTNKQIEVKTLNYITFKSKDALVDFVLSIRADSLALRRFDKDKDSFYEILDKRIEQLFEKKSQEAVANQQATQNQTQIA